MLVLKRYQRIEMNCLEFSNNWYGSSELLVNHKSKNSHHSGTSVVQLNGTLGKLGLFIKGVPAEVKGAVTEVTNVFISSSLNVLHDSKLKESNEGKDLEGSSNRNLKGASPSFSDISEGGSGVVNVSWKTDSGTGGDLSEEGKLGDTSVLELDVTETVETLLVGIIEQSQRIEEAKRRLSTKLVLEGVEGGGGLAGLGRGESGGRADKGSDDGRLHFG
mmetsp:Transcript_13043/g.18682  ORF Transcript_13043/g.18682 Transcript_13043/m.18682 type:complete len:218 (+) Transcript_13043:132-785(+)